MFFNINYGHESKLLIISNKMFDKSSNILAERMEHFVWNAIQDA
jgi:hypothetical protein